MSRSFDAYIARQAATVGRRAQPVARPVWVPQLPGAQGVCLGKLDAGSGVITYLSLALFADGRSLLTGHNDGTIRRWDLASGVVIWTTHHGHTRAVEQVALSPDQMCVASASSDHSVRLWDPVNGQALRRLDGHTDQVYQVCWSPDGQRLASASDDRTIRLWDAPTGQHLRMLQGHTDMIHGLAWAPDGQHLATSSYDRTIQLWDLASGSAHLLLQLHDQRGTHLSWSPNGHHLLVGCGGGALLLVDVAQGTASHRWQLGSGWVTAFAWSPDGRFIAATGQSERTIHIWEAQTGAEVAHFDGDEPIPFQLVWATDGRFLAVSHRRLAGDRDIVCFWDTRHLLPANTITETAPSSLPLAAHLHLLPATLAQLHRLGCCAPLSLIRDLLDLTGGRAVEGPLASLASEPGLAALVALRWPAPARVGLVALLLHQLPLADWQPPAGVTSSQLRDALTTALQGEQIAPEAPPVPLALLREAARLIDDRLLALLSMLGPDAVAADPALPLRLLPQVPSLPALNASQRRLLGVRVRLAERGGQASGRNPAAERALVGGVESGRLRTDWSALLPSQLALDKQLLAYRYARGELLFRAYELAEPPRLRPTVLLLDTSPPAFGPVEASTRLAAFLVARTLHAASVPVVLLTPTDQGEQVLALERSADLLEIWTQRTLQPLDAARALRVASAVRANLSDGSAWEPVVLLLSQPWCGAEAEVPSVTGLRGLFVQYPGQQVRPVLAGRCERWRSVAAGQAGGLAAILGELLG